MKIKIPEFFRPGVMLLLVAVIAAFVLAGVSLATSGRIEKLAEEKMTTAMQNVLPAASYADTGFAPDGEVEAIYEAAGGWVVQVTESGSQGLVTLMVGVDRDYRCTGISVLESSETAGLGAIAGQASEKGEAFRAQFVGAESPVAVTKEGGVIDAISGATITSKAVSKGVTAAIEACKALDGAPAGVIGGADGPTEIFVTDTQADAVDPDPSVPVQAASGEPSMG